MRSYNETLEYMFGMLPMFQRQGPSAFKKDLTNIKNLLKHLGNPEQSFKCIHIAGTNGKGSTSHYIASILQEHDLQVGLYTSPHYKDFRERIKINGVFISKIEVQRFIHDLEDVIQTIRPSFFELTVAMSFEYFKKQKVDIAIIETGLGGRLDSTNVLNPLLSVITNIGLDHQNMLGDTLEEIAAEKAGIIKYKTPVVIGERQSSIKSIFAMKCKSESTQYQYADEIATVDYQGFKLLDANEEISLDLSHLPNFQIKNIQTAVASILTLQDDLVGCLSILKIKKAIIDVHENTYFIGRWMTLAQLPTIIADSAHNIDGIQYLVDRLSLLEYDQLHIVMGVVDDKDHKVVFPLLPKSAKYYFAKAEIPRGMQAGKLKDIAAEYGLVGKKYSSVRKAFAASKKSAKASDLIIICGSIFVVAEVI